MPRPTHPLLSFLASTLTLAMVVAASASRAAADPPASPSGSPDALVQFLPAGVESMLLVPSVPRLLDAMRDTPFGEIYANARYRTLLGPLVNLLELDSPELGAAVRGETPSPAVSLPGALLSAEYPAFRIEKQKTPRVVLYQTPPGGAPDFLEVLLASMGSPSSRVNRATPPVAGHPVVALQTLREIRESIELRGDARKARRDQLRDLGLTEDDLGFEPVSTRRELTEELFFAGPDIVVHVTGGRPLLEAVLTRLAPAGEPAGLLAEKKWQAARASLASNPHLLLYRDLRPDQGSSRRKLDDEDYRLGLNEIRSIVAGLNLLEDRLAFEIAIYAPEPRLGLGKLLFTNAPLHVPGFETLGFLPVDGYERDPARLVPADAVAYSAFSADLARLWTDAYRILKAGAPDVAELLDIYFQAPGARGDFASNFAATFGSRWITFSRFPADADARDPSDAGSPAEMTAMLEIRDAEALAPVLDAWIQNLAQLLNLSAEPFTVSGRRYYSLRGAEILDPRLTPLGPIAYVCLAERWLIFSVRQEHILAALARLQSRSMAGPAAAASGAAPLFRDPGLVRLRSDLPGDRFFEALALPVARDQMMLSPVMLLLDEALDEAAHSLVALDRAPREDVWRDAFGATGMALRAADPAIVADLAIMYRPAID